MTDIVKERRVKKRTSTALNYILNIGVFVQKDIWDVESHSNSFIYYDLIKFHFIGIIKLVWSIWKFWKLRF